jgi:hypothetical protein
MLRGGFPVTFVFSPWSSAEKLSAQLHPKVSYFRLLLVWHVWIQQAALDGDRSRASFTEWGKTRGGNCRRVAVHQGTVGFIFQRQG